MTNSQKVHHRNFASLSIVTTIRVLIVSSIIMIATDRIEAALIISVEEDTVNNEINFSWNGIIGDSGTGTTYSTAMDANYMVPANPSFSVADQDRSDVSSTGIGGWTSVSKYDGPSTDFGSGGFFVAFEVNGMGIPWGVRNSPGYPSALLVGAVTDGGVDQPDLATHTFSGSFTLTGNFATYGLFDTVGADISAGPVTLWSAPTGSGSIVFQNATIPEPSTAFLLSCLGLLLAAGRVRRR